MNKLKYIPSLFTFLNFFWGFFSLVKTMEGNYLAAAWFIILAILCDGMDGKLARWTDSESPFGFELDSLADLVSAGIAPALLVYRGALHNLGFIGILLSFIYVFAGGYRLARFNVVQAGDRTKGYTGLPIPIAGMVLAGFWMFYPTASGIIPYFWWIPLLFGLTTLMVSKIPYDWPTLVFGQTWQLSVRSCLILGSVALMALFPQYTLFPFLILFVVLGLSRWLVELLRGEQSLGDFFLRN